MAETGGAVTRGPARAAGGHAGAPGNPHTRTRLAAEALLVLLAALLALYGTRERDFWFHLAAGRSIVSHGLPATESWCLAALGQWPWLGEWLFHVALYLARLLAGDLGVALWRAAWSGLAMALALGLARGMPTAAGSGAGLAAAALVAPLVLAVVRARLAARPEQVTVALVLLVLLVLERARRGGRDRSWWLVPISAVWANLHPGWILGPLVAVLYAALEALRRETAARRRALRWGALALALYAAGAVSPRPLDALSLRLMRDVRADPMMATIEELRPWSWGEDRAQPYTALVALALAAAALGARRAWRASPPLTLAALAALAGGLASFRFRALGALVALPALAAALAAGWAARAPRGAAASAGAQRSATAGGQGAAEPRGATDRDTGAATLAGRLAATLAVLAALAGVGWLVADAKYFPPGIAPLEDAVPVRAVALADSLGIEGPVLNTSWYGGYILWARGERHLPLQDTRNLGSAELRSRLVRARLDPAALDTLLAERGFTHAILEPPMDPADHLAGFLFHRPGWALVFADDAGLLFVRRDHCPAVAAARAYTVMSPEYAEMGALAARALADPVLGHALAAELERSREGSPWNARADLWLGLLALARGDARGALAHFDRVERLAPATPGLALRQGAALELLGDAAAARRAYRRALRDTADAALAREALARIGR